jgi:hypothetical protein
MNNAEQFDRLMQKGDPQSIWTAFEALRAEKRTGIPADEGPLPMDFEAVAEDDPNLALLEQIALRPTPRERIEHAARQSSPWKQTLLALSSIAISLAALMAVFLWVPGQWQSDRLLSHRLILALVVVMAGTLSVVTIGAPLVLLFRTWMAPADIRPGRRGIAVPVCAVIACISWIGTVASRVPLADDHLPSTAEVAASLVALRDDGLQLRQMAGTPVPPKSKDWETVTVAVEDAAVETLKPVIEAADAEAADVDTTLTRHQMLTLLVNGLKNAPRNQCVIAASDQDLLRCDVKVSGATFTGAYPLDRVAANMSVFPALERYADRIQK